MKLYQLAMSVPDLDVAEAFYRDVLGARFVARFDPPGLAFFDLDGVRILFEQRRGRRKLGALPVDRRHGGTRR